MAPHQSCIDVIMKNLGTFQDFEAYSEDKLSCPGGQVTTLAFEIADLLEVTILESEGLILEMVQENLFKLVRRGGVAFYAEFTSEGHAAWESAGA